MVKTYRSMKGADSNYLCLWDVIGWFHNRANVARVGCSLFHAFFTGHVKSM